MKSSDKVRVLLVDDHPMFRKGLADAFTDAPELTIVGEAGDATAALAFLRNSPVEVVVVDVSMPGVDGLELSRQLLAFKKPPGIVVLTMHNSEKIFNAAIDLGVRGYIVKDEAVQNIVTAIRKVAAGQSYVSPALSEFVMRRGRERNRLREACSGLHSLTAAERSILRRVAEDKPSKRIAAELFISPRTVGTHRNNISTKLGLTGSHSLLSFALTHKSEILSLPD